MYDEDREDRWAEWFESMHSCDIRKVDDFFYCDTHDSEAGSFGKCYFASGDPLASDDEEE